MSKTAVQILREARALLAEPERWCQGWYARTADGLDVGSTSPDACRWCLLGACERAANADPYEPKQDEALEALLRAIPGNRPPMLAPFNDNHSHAEVLALFDRAIQTAEAEEARNA